MPQRTTRISALTIEIVAGRPSILGAVPDGPVQGPPPRLAPRGRAQRRCSPPLMLAWNPQVGDLAAQVFRTELFQHAGLAIWNGSWYGGHYTLTYSLLFPPLAALLGPQVVGHARGRRLLLPLRPPRPRPLGRRRRAGRRSGSPPGSSPCSPTASSPSPSGSPSASPRCAALQVGRAPARGRRSPPACALASPVAGAFLAGVVLAGALRARQAAQPRRARRRGARPRPRPSSPTSPSPNRASSPSSSPPSSRSRSGAAAPLVTRGLRARSASCAG